MIEALIGAGASLLGGLLSSSATSKATKEAVAAQERAQARNEALAREQMALAQQYNSPYATAGVPAVNALQQRVLPGSVPSRNALTSQPAAMSGPPGAVVDPVRQAPVKTGGVRDPIPTNEGQILTQSPGQPDWNAYLEVNPDVAQHYATIPEAQKQAMGLTTPQAWAQFHYQQVGQSEGRQLPTSGQGPVIDLAQNAETGVYGVPDQFAERPAAQPFTWDNPGEPGMGSALDDPGFHFAKDQALKAVTASKYAGDLGRSGGRLLALQDRAGDVANRYYNEGFNRQLALYQTKLSQFNRNRDTARSWYDIDQTRGDARFDTDRGFNTSRFDTQTGDLFRLTGVGLTGAGNIVGAGQNMTNALTQGNNSLADTQGNAAIARANNTNALVQSGLQTLGMFGAGGFGGGGYNPPRPTYGQPTGWGIPVF